MQQSNNAHIFMKRMQLGLKDKNSVIYSIWSLFRLVIFTLLFIVIINVIPFMISGRLNSELLNYSIAIAIFLGVLVDIKWIEKKALDCVGLCFRCKDIAFFAGGILLAILGCGVIVGLVSVIRCENLYLAAIESVVNSERGLMAYVVIPFSEELFHRGYFMGHTFPRLSYRQRSVLSAFLFSLSHWLYSGYSSIFMFIVAMAIGTFLFGLLFNHVRMLNGSIWMGFAVHWFFNFIYSCIFLETENYDIATVILVILLSFCVVLTGIWIKKKAGHQL